MPRPFLLFCATAAALGSLGSTAAAEQPSPPQAGAAGAQPLGAQAQPGAPQPAYPQGQPGYPQQPGYPPPGYGGYPPPQGGYGYPPPAYGAYVYAPPAGSPPPPEPKPSTCCRWAIRVNPFDLLFRKLSFEGELAIVGPLSVELTGSWIFGAFEEDIDEKGVALGANVGFYFMNVDSPRQRPLQGMWLKGHFGYENYTATVKNPDTPSSTASRRLSSAIVGAMIGSSAELGRDGGFMLSGGIGLGVALAGPVTLTAPGGSIMGGHPVPPHSRTFYEKIGKIQLLGSLGLGVAF